MASDQRPAALVVDLAGVTFCCARGFHTLLADTAAITQTIGILDGVSGLSPHLQRIADMLPMWQRCTRYRSAAAASAALRGEQAPRSS